MVAGNKQSPKRQIVLLLPQILLRFILNSTLDLVYLIKNKNLKIRKCLLLLCKIRKCPHTRMWLLLKFYKCTNESQHTVRVSSSQKVNQLWPVSSGFCPQCLGTLQLRTLGVSLPQSSGSLPRGLSRIKPQLRREPFQCSGLVLGGFGHSHFVPTLRLFA